MPNTPSVDGAPPKWGLNLNPGERLSYVTFKAPFRGQVISQLADDRGPLDPEHCSLF
jgi:hypothetical protein